jgi:hypothetical protein
LRPAAARGAMQVVVRGAQAVTAVVPVVRHGYFIVVPRPVPAVPLVDFRRYLIVVPRSLPRRRDAVAAGEEQIC